MRRHLPAGIIAITLALGSLLGVSIYHETVAGAGFLRSLALNAPQLALALLVGLGVLAALSRDGSPDTTRRKTRKDETGWASKR